MEVVKVVQMEVELLEIVMVVVEIVTIVEKKESVEAEVVVMEVEMPILSACRELMLEEHLVLVMLPLFTMTQ